MSILNIPITAAGADRGVSDWIRKAASAVNSLINQGVSVKAYTVATLPSAVIAGQIIYVSNEVSGAVLAFSDGAAWRRVTDRAIVA